MEALRSTLMASLHRGALDGYDLVPSRVLAPVEVGVCLGDDGLEFVHRCCGHERAVDALGLHRTLGDAHSKSDRHAEAAEAYRRHLKLRPEDGRTWPSLMGALLKAGRQEELLAFLRQKIELLKVLPAKRSYV